MKSVKIRLEQEVETRTATIRETVRRLEEEIRTRKTAEESLRKSENEEDGSPARIPSWRRSAASSTPLWM